MNEQCLSTAERDRRYALIRKEMAARQLDCLVVYGDSSKWDQRSDNLQYVVNVGGNGEEGICLFPLKGEPTYFIWSNVGGVYAATWESPWLEDIRSPDERHWSTGVVKYLQERQLADRRIGVVGLGGLMEPEGIFPYTTLYKIKEALPRAEMVNATDLMERIRMVKSKEELDLMREAIRIGDEAILLFAEQVKSGMRSDKVFGHLLSALALSGSEFPVMVLFAAGPDISHALRFPDKRILVPGDIILNEISPRYRGYWAHFQRPIAISAPSPSYRKVYDVAVQSYNNALAVLRPGITLADLAAAFWEPIGKAGMKSLSPYLHGCGLRGSEFPVLKPEPPGVPVGEGARGLYDRVGKIRVEEGMVFAFEPQVIDQEGRGVHFGDPIFVTKNGYERVSRLPPDLMVV